VEIYRNAVEQIPLSAAKHSFSFTRLHRAQIDPI